MRVAVIGAGAAGLCALRWLQANHSVVCFERARSIGGIWFYTDEQKVDEFGLPVHSALYKGLSTNIPKEVMAFPDREFPESSTSYVSAEEVQKYLCDYTLQHDLACHIKFSHYVESVKPTFPGQMMSVFSVTVKDLLSGQCSTSEFDAVAVCNGHFSSPRLPELPGIETFPGQVLHSRDYRDKEHYRNQRVLVIGDGPSAFDIVVQLAPVADLTHISMKSDWFFKKFEENERLQRHDVCERIVGQRVFFKDDSVAEDVDAIIICTGYNFSFPFLQDDIHPKIDSQVMFPLYNHIVHPEYSRLLFVGLRRRYTFAMCYQQAGWVDALLSNHFSLPSVEDMWKHINDLNSLCNVKKGSKDELLIQYEYLQRLAGEADIPPLAKHYFDVFKYSSSHRAAYPLTYKNYIFKYVYAEDGSCSVDALKSDHV